jgi:paired amphipathic helix protein Sin3a
MEGSLEQSKFEDDCRDMFGISSYILFTIDKLIVHLAKQVCPPLPMLQPIR